LTWSGIGVDRCCTAEPDEVAFDVLIDSWHDIDRQVRLEDQPGSVGTGARYGLFLRALRVHDKYELDVVDVSPDSMRCALSQPPEGGEGRTAGPPRLRSHGRPSSRPHPRAPRAFKPQLGRGSS
jgi:hypothetical protein